MLLTRPHEIYELSAKLLLWEHQIAKAPDFYFNKLLQREAFQKGQPLAHTPEHLKADLLETLHFVVDQLHRAAASGKYIVVAGF